MLLSPLLQMMTVPFTAGKLRVEVNSPLATPTGRAWKFPVITSMLPGASVISLPGKVQMAAIPWRVHWRITSSPEHGKPNGDCCVRRTSLWAV